MASVKLFSIVLMLAKFFKIKYRYILAFLSLNTPILYYLISSISRVFDEFY